MFRRTKICTELMLAFGGTLAIASLPAGAQEAPQRIEITGSLIKRVNAEGPAPVEVLTRKDIAKTGATTLNELVRSIPSIDVFDQGELASNSPSGSGTANLKMRGLDSSNLLILLNGRRLPVNALYDSSGAGAAVDVNMIPVSAIERVDILKDGGSAIYGADAVAGVINIITKTDYQGFEARADYGRSSRNDAAEKQAGLTFGYGDLTKDRFNVLVGLDMFKRDPIYRKDRDLTSSVNFTRFGGRDARSSFSPYGNIVDPNTGATKALQYRTCPASDLDSKGICRFDFNQSILTSYNGADRVSGLGILSYQVTPDIRAFAEITMAETKDHFEAQPVPDYFILPINNPAQEPYDIPDANGNPTHTVYVAGRFMQGGPRITDRKADLLNAVLGAEGTNFGLDWKVNVGRGESKVTNTDHNYFDRTKWNVATSNGSLDPTVLTNDQALVDSLKIDPVRTGKATTSYVNGQASGEAWSLPGGPVGYAVGFNFTRETLEDTPDPIIQAGNEVGGIAQAAVSAGRNEYALFGELRLPILKQLEAQAAVRYDHYPSYSQTSPKFALKYNFSQQLAVRGSYTESFRAPVLKQLYGAQEQGATTITDPNECAIISPDSVSVDPATGEKSCQINAFQVNGSNPNLKPEKGKTYNLGLVMDAGVFNASVDYWRVEKSDDISTPSLDTAIRLGHWDKTGARINVYTNLLNFAQQKVEGVDLDARFRLPGTALGNLTLRDSATYYMHQMTRDEESSPWTEYNGTYATPRYRNTITATSEMGPWTTTAALRTVGGFKDTDNPDLTATAKSVPSYSEIDLQEAYSGIKDLTLTVGVHNLADRMPPFSATNANSNSYTQMGFAELYNVRGRFFYMGATYKFR